MSLRLRDKVAIVLGSTSGIGEAIVRRYAREGARVVVAGRRKDLGEKIAREIVQDGGVAEYIQVDATDAAQVRHLCEETVRIYGRLDIALNAQGWNQLFLLENLECEKFDYIVRVCLNSMFYAIKYECEQMRKSGGGVIINISSINSTVANNYQGAYCAAKAGLDMLTNVAAIEYGQYGIRVNTINPGLTKTDLGEFIFGNRRAYRAFMEKTPLRTYAVPEDIADAAVFLASQEARFISAEHLYVDGGITPEGYPDAFRIAIDDEERYKFEISEE